jgi:plastocyanin
MIMDPKAAAGAAVARATMCVGQTWPWGSDHEETQNQEHGGNSVAIRARLNATRRGNMSSKHVLALLASAVLAACANSPKAPDSQASDGAMPGASSAPLQTPPAASVPPPPAAQPPQPLPPPPPPPGAAMKGSTHVDPTVKEATAKTPPAVSVPKATSVLTGHIDMADAGAGDIGQAVAYFVPDAGAPKSKPGDYRIYTHLRAFDPPSLVIPIGSRIIFPNQDDILHNVFSATPGSEFDLGTYAEDERAAYTFKKAGVVTINCNVHQDMQANVLVVATPYFANADAQGDFRLANLPAGSGKLTLWHPRAQSQTLVVTVPLREPLTLQLALTRPAVSAHLNKERKQYRPSQQAKD